MTRSPTVRTLQILLVVFFSQVLVQLFLGYYSYSELFVLTTPLTDSPWTIVSSVYAHGGIFHLLTNAFALALFGLAVERVTTPARFYLFFLGVGVIGGVTQVVVSDLVGPSVAVVGASGAIFGLLGYALTGNALAEGVLSRLSQRAQAMVFLGVAAVVTIMTAGPGVALLAHFVGLVVGLIAGRLRLLHTDGTDTEESPTVGTY